MPEYRSTATFLLAPNGHFRFGTHPAAPESASPLPASDTLFGALMGAAALLGDAVDRVVDQFLDGAPPFLISSALPHLDGREPFVPRPQRWRERGNTDEVAPTQKGLKQAAYVELPVLRWYRGEPLETVAWGPLIITGTVAPLAPPWSVATIPGVTVDRVSGASALYHGTIASYGKGRSVARQRRAGLPEVHVPAVFWAVHVLAADDQALDRVHRWLDALSLLGIGGRRSRGTGTFRVERRQPSIIPLSAAPRGLSLSWVAPRRDEIERGVTHPNRTLGHRVDERVGWSSSPAWLAERSKRLRMFGEGSYLSPHLSPPVGRLVDVTPGPAEGRHRLFRYGFGLFLDEEALP